MSSITNVVPSTPGNAPNYNDMMNVYNDLLSAQQKLLEDLASGNIAGAKKELEKMQADLSHLLKDANGALFADGPIEYLQESIQNALTLLDQPNPNLSAIENLFGSTSTIHGEERNVFAFITNPSAPFNPVEPNFNKTQKALSNVEKLYQELLYDLKNDPSKVEQVLSELQNALSSLYNDTSLSNLGSIVGKLLAIVNNAASLFGSGDSKGAMALLESTASSVENLFSDIRSSLLGS